MDARQLVVGHEQAAVPVLAQGVQRAGLLGTGAGLPFSHRRPGFSRRSTDSLSARAAFSNFSQPGYMFANFTDGGALSMLTSGGLQGR